MRVLLLASSIKLVCEIALMAMLGQWVLGLLAGARRDENIFYQLFQVLTRPVTGAVRAVTPRVVLDRHIPLAAVLLLILVWGVATAWKIRQCLQVGVQQCS